MRVRYRRAAGALLAAALGAGIPQAAHAGVLAYQLHLAQARGTFHLGGGLGPVTFQATSPGLTVPLSTLLASPPLGLFGSAATTTALLPATLVPPLSAVRFGLGSQVTPAPPLRIDLLAFGGALTVVQVPVPVGAHTGTYVGLGGVVTARGGAWTTGVAALTTPSGLVATSAGYLFGPTTLTPSIPTPSQTAATPDPVQVSLVKPIHLVTSLGYEPVGFLRVTVQGFAIQLVPEPGAGALLLGALAAAALGGRRRSRA